MSGADRHTGQARRSIGIVTGSASRQAGGLFNSVRKSALHLAQAGIDVGVYALRDEFSDKDIGDWAPLTPRLFATKGPAALGLSQGVLDALLAADHDVLHLHGIWQFLSRDVLRWKLATGRPVMISPRGMLDSWALRNSAWKKKLAGALFENRNLREADCLHALNASEAASMRAYGLMSPIAVIPNAADLPEIAPRRAHDGKKTLLFLGRIHPKKGLSQLLAAWARAAADDPALADQWSITIAGWDDRGHLATLVRQIADLGIGTSVSVHGPAFGADKERLLREADAFVLPSFSEGLPMSVLEAWAYRLPVLMTAQCNLPEGFTAGAAVEITTDPEPLSRKLKIALLDEDLHPMGEAGRALVEERFSWSHVARQHLAVYEWLVGGGERPPCVTGALA